MKDRRSPPSVRAGRLSTTWRTFISAFGARRIRTATSIRCSSCPPGRLRLLRPRLHLPLRRRLLRLLPRLPRRRPRLRRYPPPHRRLRRALRLPPPRRPRRGRRAHHRRSPWDDWRRRPIAGSAFGRARRSACSTCRKPAFWRVARDKSSLGRYRRAVEWPVALRVAHGGRKARLQCGRAQAWIAGIA